MLPMGRPISQYMNLFSVKNGKQLTESAIDPPSLRTFSGFDNRASAGPGFRPDSAPTSIYYQGFGQKPLPAEISGAFFFEKSIYINKDQIQPAWARGYGGL